MYGDPVLNPAKSNTIAIVILGSTAKINLINTNISSYTIINSLYQIYPVHVHSWYTV